MTDNTSTESGPFYYEVKRSVTAMLCPVCNGAGKIRSGHAFVCENGINSFENEKECRCHGCNGKGWIKLCN